MRNTSVVISLSRRDRSLIVLFLVAVLLVYVYIIYVNSTDRGTGDITSYHECDKLSLFVFVASYDSDQIECS